MQYNGKCFNFSDQFPSILADPEQETSHQKQQATLQEIHQNDTMTIAIVHRIVIGNVTEIVIAERSIVRAIKRKTFVYIYSFRTKIFGRPL